MYATHDKDGNVTGHYKKPVPGSVELTPTQWQLSCSGRLRIVDGKPVVYTAPGPTLEECKAARITEIKAACSATIYAVYPLWKQISLMRENNTGDMAAFIDEQRIKCDTLEDAINAAKTTIAVNSIVWGD